MIQFDQTLGKNANSRWKNDDLMFARLVIDRLIFQIIGYYKIFIFNRYESVVLLAGG